MQEFNLDVTLHPPTPSTVNSNFTRLAKGLVREIEAKQSRWHVPLEVEVMHVNIIGFAPTAPVSVQEQAPKM